MNSKGFTLVELIILLVIIVFLFFSAFVSIPPGFVKIAEGTLEKVEYNKVVDGNVVTLVTFQDGSKCLIYDQKLKIKYPKGTKIRIYARGHQYLFRKY